MFLFCSMSATCPIDSQDQDPAAARPANPGAGEAASDAVLELAARQLEHLAELRGIGMALARSLKDQAEAGAASGGGDPGLSFVRIARAVRQIIALETEISGLREKHLSRLSQLRLLERKQIVRRVVQDAVLAEEPDIDRDDMKSTLDDLFCDYEDYDDGDSAPGSIAETVARICRMLNVRFDPELWRQTVDEVAAKSATRRGAAQPRPRRGPYEIALTDMMRRFSGSQAGRHGPDPP